MLAAVTSIAGLDVTSGLSRLRGRQESYIRLLGIFASSHADTVTTLRGQLELDELSKAQALLHTLKGSAATVGATALAQHAQDLELALRNQAAPEEIAPRLRLLEASLTALLGGIRSVVPSG